MSGEWALWRTGIGPGGPEREVEAVYADRADAMAEAARREAHEAERHTRVADLPVRWRFSIEPVVRHGARRAADDRLRRALGIAVPEAMFNDGAEGGK